MIPAYGNREKRSFTVSTFEGGLNMRYDEQCTSLGYSTEAYNVQTRDGALSRCGGFDDAKQYRAGVGEVSVTAPPIVSELAVLRAGEMLFTQGARGRYKETFNTVQNIYEWTRLSASAFPELTYYVNYNLSGVDGMLCGSPDGPMSVVTGSNITEIHEAPRFYRAVLHYERLFGIGTTAEPNRIWFSKQFAPAVFTVSAQDGGYIDVLGDNGSAVDIIPFDGALYVFWQYGITRIRAFSFQSEFSVSQIYSSTGEIARGSVQQCSEGIIFAARDGIYLFNGSSVRRISDPVCRLFTGAEQTFASAFFRGSYYLAMRLEKYGGEGNNVLLKYSLADGKWELMAKICVKQLIVLRAGEEKLLFSGEDSRLSMLDASEKFGSRDIESKWVTPKSALGLPHIIKRSTEVLISGNGAGRIKLTLHSENGSDTGSVWLSEDRRMYRVPLHVTGRLLWLEIENENGCDFTVVSPTVYYIPY